MIISFIVSSACVTTTTCPISFIILLAQMIHHFHVVALSSPSYTNLVCGLLLMTKRDINVLCVCSQSDVQEREKLTLFFTFSCHIKSNINIGQLCVWRQITTHMDMKNMKRREKIVSWHWDLCNLRARTCVHTHLLELAKRRRQQRSGDGEFFCLQHENDLLCF